MNTKSPLSSLGPLRIQKMTLHRSLVACLMAITMAFAFLASFPTMAQVPAAPVFSQAELSATPSTVKSFLAHVDSGDYPAAWQMVSKYVSTSTSPQIWTTGLRGLRAAAGPLKTRNAVATGPIPTDDKMPAGRYFAIFYQSSFANTEAEEKVILSLEAGDWKVAGYSFPSALAHCASDLNSSAASGQALPTGNCHKGAVAGTANSLGP